MQFLVIFLAYFIIVISGDDYFTSLSAIQKLVKVEKQLLSVFSAYSTLLEKRMEKVKDYLEDYESSVLAATLHNPGSDLSILKDKHELETDLEELSVQVSSHPLKTHRLIRRFVVQLQELEKDLGSQEEKQLLNAMEEIRKGFRFPQERDVEGSIEALLRIQDAYDLNITEFTQGMFQGLDTKSRLTAADCHQIGTYAFMAQIHTRSIEWLHRAYIMASREGDLTALPKSVLLDLEAAVQQHDEAQEEDATNIYVYRRPIQSVQNLMVNSQLPSMEKVADHRQYVLYKEQANIQDLYNFAALCSGKQLQSERKRSSLKCFNQKVEGAPILSEKIEFLHVNPDVVQVYSVLPDRAIDRILELATPSMSRSKVQGGVWEEQHSNARTSTSSWIKENGENRLRALSSRITGLTGLTTRGVKAAEDLQVSSYGIGGHYNPHLDLLFEDYVPEPEEQAKGDRIATFLFYLSDVARGGGTAFPRLGIVAQPVKGSTIFWYNLKRDGSADPLSLHGGCPVLYGTKHVANKWIRANAQFLTRKCLTRNMNN